MTQYAYRYVIHEVNHINYEINFDAQQLKHNKLVTWPPFFLPFIVPGNQDTVKPV